jgi:hypothetical protein
VQEPVVGAQQGKHPMPAMASVDAKFDRWLVAPTGRVHGMLLDDGSIVRVRHDVDASAIGALTKGDAVHVEGARFGDAKVFGMAEVKKDGVVVLAAPKHHDGKGHHPMPKFDGAHAEKGHHDGWKKHHDEEMAALSPMTAKGTVVAILPGHGGAVHALVLSDGTIAYAPHREDLSSFSIAKGDTVEVEGRGGEYPAGRALEIKTLDAKGTKKTF